MQGPWLAGCKIIRARTTAGQSDLGHLKRDPSNPAQSTQIGPRTGQVPQNRWASRRTRGGCDVALPTHEFTACAASSNWQEPAMPLYGVTPCIFWEDAILQGTQHPLPATQPASPGWEALPPCPGTGQRCAVPCLLPHRGTKHVLGLASCHPHPPGCLLHSQHGATSNFPSWLRALS